MKNSRGFTLVELLVVLAITGIIGTAIMNLYVKSIRVQTAQTTLVRTQQNLRATLDYLVGQIRMAGYSNNTLPGGGDAGAGVVTATASRFHFTADLDESGTVGVVGAGAEDFDIRLKADDDTDGDGIAD